MSIDDKVTRDTRVMRLANLCGWSRRETIGCLLDVWAVCYDRALDTLPSLEIDLAAECDGFADRLCSVGLGFQETPNAIRIAGVAERIGYLKKAVENGRAGGVKAAQLRRDRNGNGVIHNADHLVEKHATLPNSHPTRVATSHPLPPRYPPDPVPDPVPDPSPANALDQTPHNPPAGGNGSRKAKTPNSGFRVTPEESAIVRTVLGRLTKHNGVNYSASAEHTRLIVTQLRRGLTEMDLRKVIYYCATVAFPEDKPEMRQYLRPETLFGPRTIERYLDPARSWFDTLPKEPPGKP